MRGGPFPAAGIGQAQNLPQRIRQKRILRGIAGQPVVRGVHDEHTPEMQQPRLKHAENLESREGIGLKRHALLPEYFAGHAVQGGQGKGRAGQQVFAQNRYGLPHEPVHGLGVQGKVPPQVITPAAQKGAQAMQHTGHVFCGRSSGRGAHEGLQCFFKQLGQRFGQLPPALQDNLIQVHEAGSLTDDALQRPQGVTQQQGLPVRIAGTQHVHIWMAQALQKMTPVVAAFIASGGLQAQQSIQQAVQRGPLQRIAHGHVDVFMRQVVQHRHKQRAVRKYNGRGMPRLHRDGAAVILGAGGFFCCAISWICAL